MEIESIFPDIFKLLLVKSDVIKVSESNGPIPEIKDISSTGENWQDFKMACNVHQSMIQFSAWNASDWTQPYNCILPSRDWGIECKIRAEDGCRELENVHRHCPMISMLLW